VLRYGHNCSVLGVESSIQQLGPIVQRAEILSKHAVQLGKTLT